MMNAFDQPQTILVLGGRSDIAHAIVRELSSPALQTVVLAHRGGPPAVGCPRGRTSRPRRIPGPPRYLIVL